MIVTELRVCDFRNLQLAHVEPNSRFNIFEGNNGQGKTNLLECIYVLGALKSFRAARNAEMIRFGESRAEIRGVVHHQQSDRVVRVNVGKTGRQVWLDGKLSRSLVDSLGQLTVVLFAPEDLTITKGSPSVRRRFLDRALFNRWRNSLGDLQRFEQTLKQRNALLKDEGPESLLEVFDQQVSEAGARVWAWRERYLADYGLLLTECLAQVSDDELAGSIELSSKVADRSAAGYLKALQADRRRDRARRTTSSGPQVDDLECSLNGQSARAYASQGQHRAFVLAMKIAEIRLLKRELGYSPVLLLDDVSSELDARRNELLMNYLTSEAFGGQVFLTTTDRAYVRIDSDYSCFRIRGGAID